MNLSWLNPSSIYAKLIASAIVLALVGGAYFYVRNLNHQVVQLKIDNAEQAQTNKQLTDEIKSEGILQSNINKVSQAGDAQRTQIKVVYESQLKKIDDNSKAGKDRKVGPLLEEFFNE